MMDVTWQTVCRLYEHEPSIKGIARRLNLSHGKIKKILITTGYIDTPESQLYREGKTIAEIMEITGKGSTAICNNIPYARCMYNAEYPTLNALNIRKCRERKKETTPNDQSN